MGSSSPYDPAHRRYGEVPGPPIGEMSRRSFMRRMLGVGVGLLSLEFLGGTPRLPVAEPHARAWAAAITLGTRGRDHRHRSREWADGLAVRSTTRRASSSSTCRPRKSLVENDGNVGRRSRIRARTSTRTAAGRAVGAGAVAQVPAPRLPDPAAVRPELLVRVPLPRLEVHDPRREARRSRAARHGPLHRHRRPTAPTSSTPARSSPGRRSGTVTFDDRDRDPDAALRGLVDAPEDARGHPASRLSRRSRCSTGSPMARAARRSRPDHAEELLAYGRGDLQRRRHPSPRPPAARAAMATTAWAARSPNDPDGRRAPIRSHTASLAQKLKVNPDYVRPRGQLSAASSSRAT